jgi:hypothetical protein
MNYTINISEEGVLLLESILAQTKDNVIMMPNPPKPKKLTAVEQMTIRMNEYRARKQRK